MSPEVYYEGKDINTLGTRWWFPYYVYSYVNLYITRLRKLVGTSGAIKRIISHMNILVNLNNMSFKVHTCWESLVLFAAKVIVRLCVCLLYVSRCLLWGLGYFHIEDREMVFVLYVFSCDSLGHKTEKRITYKWNSKQSKALSPLWIFLWILIICVSKLQHVKKVLSHWL